MCSRARFWEKWKNLEIKKLKTPSYPPISSTCGTAMLPWKKLKLARTRKTKRTKHKISFYFKTRTDIGLAHLFYLETLYFWLGYLRCLTMRLFLHYKHPLSSQWIVLLMKILSNKWQETERISSWIFAKWQFRYFDYKRVDWSGSILTEM